VRILLAVLMLTGCAPRVVVEVRCPEPKAWPAGAFGLNVLPNDKLVISTEPWSFR
jgi:hypothetical protein